MKSDDTTDAKGDILGELLERERQLLARNEEGIAAKHPQYLDDYQVYWRPSPHHREALQRDGLTPDFDRVLDGRPQVRKRSEHACQGR